jgi:hypothetical protein
VKRHIILIPIILVLAALIGVTTASAQLANAPSAPQSGYELSWHTVDSGGTTSISGGSYLLAGSIGEPESGSASSGPYTLSGGFWSGAILSYNTYLPVGLKGV